MTLNNNLIETIHAYNDADIINETMTITVNDDSDGHYHYEDIISRIERMRTDDIMLTIINNSHDETGYRISELLYVLNDYSFKELHYVTTGCELMSADVMRGVGLIIGSLIKHNLTVLTVYACNEVNPDRIARAVGLIGSNASKVRTIINGTANNKDELIKLIKDYDWIAASELNIILNDSESYYHNVHITTDDMSDYDISMLTRFTPVNIIHNASVNDDSIDYDDINVHNRVNELVRV